jgi:hypothetical protein
MRLANRSPSCTDPYAPIYLANVCRFLHTRSDSTDLNQAEDLPRWVLRLFRTRHSKFIQRGNGRKRHDPEH